MVQSLCGLGLVDGGPGGGELGGCEVAVGGVGSVDVVVDAPGFDDHSGLPRGEVTSNVWCREALREDVSHAQAVSQGVP